MSFIHADESYPYGCALVLSKVSCVRFYFVTVQYSTYALSSLVTQWRTHRICTNINARSTSFLADLCNFFNTVSLGSVGNEYAFTKTD
ncbi:hypothetical protein HanRHA438_Chr10g0455421 [Helianthus annuus]|nr:hypothetical protein HanIR_Chr10g0477771 [Helianthus annuus]KAJ0879776.1 hypothetical protein HanRHA438_Chr10g0455421 [Helianthus annuus]